MWKKNEDHWHKVKERICGSSSVKEVRIRRWSVPPYTISCLTCPACKPRQKYTSSCSEKCSLPVTLPCPLSHKKDCRRKWPWWVRVSAKHPASLSGTTPWKLSRISLNSAQQCPATCPLRARSTSASIKQHQPCPVCGRTPKLTTNTKISVYNTCAEHPTLQQQNVDSLCPTGNPPQ